MTWSVPLEEMHFSLTPLTSKSDAEFVHDGLASCFMMYPLELLYQENQLRWCQVI